MKKKVTTGKELEAWKSVQEMATHAADACVWMFDKKWEIAALSLQSAKRALEVAIAATFEVQKKHRKK